MNTSAKNRRRREENNRREGSQRRNYNDQDIYQRHYARQDDAYYDPRRNYDSGRPNNPNYGREMYGDGPDSRQGYGYNQGRNSASNIGGRAYGQSYGQYFQGSDNRRHSNSRDYQGNYDPYYPGRERDEFLDEEERRRDYEDYLRYRDEMRDEYHHYGYQSSAQNEGFGQRAGHRNERQWLDEDEYRGGHAQRHRGVGKYGSR